MKRYVIGQLNIDGVMPKFPETIDRRKKMNDKTKVYMAAAWLALALFMMSGHLLATGDVLVNLRFYEGIRQDNIAKPSVVTSFYVEPFFVGNIVTEAGLKEEKNKLKRIFNVNDVKLMTQAHWTWPLQYPKRIFRVFVLNGEKFGLRLSRKQGGDAFRIEVYAGETSKKSKGKNLLDTQLDLKEKNTAIYGFETPDGKIYFLSFHREMNTEVIEESPIVLSTQYKPELLHTVRPQYPEKAMKKGIKGWVRLQGRIGLDGNIKDINVISGQPALKQAALTAVSQWRYKPPKAELPFTTVISFRLPGENNGTNGDAGKGVAANTPNIWPTRGYLDKTFVTLGFGKARDPFTKKVMFHNGIDIKAKLGAEIVAPADGLVTLVANKKGWGKMMEMDHGSGYTTRYAHLNGFNVKKGDRVKKGEVIAFVGNTGKSTGPHLHYEVRLEGEPLNPINLITDK
jgi:TonB family protein